ncbi:redoxin domain-containing protein [candidate division KSB1 bacterium]|nr:redoxin domain-containing protein [candidate division KSB1 bacterium]
MMAVFDPLINFVSWLFLASLKAVVVIALIAIVQTTFRHRLSAKWLHALWFLLIIRLTIPIDIPMPFSLFNLTKNVEPISEPFGSTANKVTEIAKSAHSIGPMATSLFNYQTPIEADVRIIPQPKITKTHIISILWLLITLILLGYTAAANVLLNRRLAKGKIVENPEILDILNRCASRLGVRREITVLSLPGISSPFWSGLFRAHIVLPQDLLLDLTDDQIEHIFMHELVHYKQKDVPLALLTTILQILHWFNPFIWIAFFKMRADREVACDELVLTNIGQDKNKQYGRTLISLIESASQRGLLPVAVGLADTKFNMKRRVTMISNFSPKSMWWTAMALLLISTIAVFALTGAQNNAIISGAITFQGGEQPQTIHIGLYRLMPHDAVVIDYVGEPLQFSEQSKTSFSFDVAPGCYTMAAWAFAYERAFVEIIVPDEKSRININFNLAQKSLPGPVTDVKLTGDFCGWDERKALALKKSGIVWRVPDNINLAKGSEYKFLVSGMNAQTNTEYGNMYRYFPGSQNVKPVKTHATYNHIYNGEDISFDPSVYITPAGKAKITVKGFDLYHQFVALQDSLRVFEIYYHDVRADMDKYIEKDEPEPVKEACSALKTRFERLEKQFDPFFAPIFHEYWLDNLLGFNPSSIDLWQLGKTHPDSAALTDFLDNSPYIPYFKSIVNRLEDLEPNSVLVTGAFWEGLRYIHMHAQHLPDFKDRIGISGDYEFDYTVNFCKSTKNRDAKQELLYHMADTYVEFEPKDMEKAAYLIEWLYKDFPDSWYITHASAENIRNSTRLRAGQPAPMFSVTTLDGEKIYTSQLRGKFVFLEFWGSNCGPCRGESPHMNNLVLSISPDSLVLIGLGHADEEKARTFVKDQKLVYKNAVAPDHVLKKYGITYYPATFLIDPDGNIIAIDLRGPELLDDVREKMRLYAEK